MRHSDDVRIVIDRAMDHQCESPAPTIDGEAHAVAHPHHPQWLAVPPGVRVEVAPGVEVAHSSGEALLLGVFRPPPSTPGTARVRVERGDGWAESAVGDEVMADPTALGHFVRYIDDSARRFSQNQAPRTPAPCSLPLPGPIPPNSSETVTIRDDHGQSPPIVGWRATAGTEIPNTARPCPRPEAHMASEHAGTWPPSPPTTPDCCACAVAGQCMMVPDCPDWVECSGRTW